jgi:hypothetical protein
MFVYLFIFSLIMLSVIPTNAASNEWMMVNNTGNCVERRGLGLI